MNYIDTHTHLYLNQFRRDIDLVIENSITNGVTKLLLPNISSKTTQSMMSLCKKYPDNCYPMIGIHPCDVNQETIDQELLHIEEMIKKEKFIGIGEIGLDLYWEKTTLDIQKKAFIFQIELAKKHNLPISIHVRDSFNEAIEIIETLNDNNLRGSFHCFTGNRKEAKRVIDLEDFYLGIGGVVSFKNSGLDNTIKDIDIKHLILETDAPYLAPVPFRGKRNESQYIVYIAKKIAEIQNIPLEKVAEITTKNSSDLFNI